MFPYLPTAVSSPEVFMCAPRCLNQSFKKNCEKFQHLKCRQFLFHFQSFNLIVGGELKHVQYLERTVGKMDKILAPGVSFYCIECTLDRYILKVIPRSFGAFAFFGNILSVTWSEIL